MLPVLKTRSIPSCCPTATKILLCEIHEKNLHSGQLATPAIACQRYWPIQGRQIIKQQIHSCIKCFRARPKMIAQFMGALPAPRITPSPTFYHTGIDYCGPFTIKTSTICNAKSEPAYVALFVQFIWKMSAASQPKSSSALSTDSSPDVDFRRLVTAITVSTSLAPKISSKRSTISSESQTLRSRFVNTCWRTKSNDTLFRLTRPNMEDSGKLVSSHLSTTSSASLATRD